MIIQSKHISILLFAILLMLPRELKHQEARVRRVAKVLEAAKPEIVTLTTYSPSVGETDSTPTITASGYKIDSINPKKHRIIAISRDLKRKYRFGAKVRISGAGKYNGTYVVRDVMNKRFKNHIDILINKDDKHTRLTNIKLHKI